MLLSSVNCLLTVNKSAIHNIMSKKSTSKPFFIIMYGYPGSGKSYFARQLSDNFQAAHLQADKIRAELFSEPRFDKQENDIIKSLMDYMAEEFLTAGLSVIYDMNVARSGQRKMLKNLANKNGAVPLTVWIQIDQESAFVRSNNRDRRKTDDKYAVNWDEQHFKQISSTMQRPTTVENYAVISGKHLFNMQQSAVVRKLRDLGVVSSDEASDKVIKPGMVNLVPNSGRVDFSRRNISIRQ